MDLLKFITYCELAGLVRKRTCRDDGTQKIVIRRGILSTVIWYYVIKDEAFIIKSNLDSGPSFDLSPALSTIVETFFPTK